MRAQETNENVSNWLTTDEFTKKVGGWKSTWKQAPHSFEGAGRKKCLKWLAFTILLKLKGEKKFREIHSYPPQCGKSNNFMILWKQLLALVSWKVKNLTKITWNCSTCHGEGELTKNYVKSNNWKLKLREIELLDKVYAFAWNCGKTRNSLLRKLSKISQSCFTKKI